MCRRRALTLNRRIGRLATQPIPAADLEEVRTQLLVCVLKQEWKVGLTYFSADRYGSTGTLPITHS